MTVTFCTRIKNWRPLSGLLLLLCVVSVFPHSVFAQVPEYDMFTGTVYDCDGILYDSGGLDGTYSSNENTVFTIASAGTIVLTFTDYFEIEACCDVIYVFDGPDTGSPLIATLNNDGVIPGSLTATSGFLTIQLISDNSAQQDGFIANWNTIAPPPPIPSININPFPTCNSSQIDIEFSYPLGCNWVENAEFTFAGLAPVPVTDVQVNCISDSTISAVLTIAQPISYNCEYTVVMDILIPDVCDSLWNYIVSSSFVFGGCPIQASLVADEDTVCTGQCTQLTCHVTGCFDYTYSWTNGLPPLPGPQVVCPTSNTTYGVTVTEVQTGNTLTLNQPIAVSVAEILQSDMSICQSQDLIDLDSSIPGTWSGPGIIDDVAGLFEPDSALAGANLILFNAGGCTDEITIVVEPIHTDSATAACPGSAPFLLNSIPGGGTWTGPFTTVAGIFDPTTTGSYNAVYLLNGCTDTTIVNVDMISSLTLDTICQSIWADTLVFTPFGGLWSGSGIVNPLYGIFDPAQATPGDIVLNYAINGCSENFDIHILEIAVDGGHSACPYEDPLVWNDPPAPPGGWWEGGGIIDSLTGYYDPGLFANDSYTSIVYHAPNGCSDTTFIHNLITYIIPATAQACVGDDPVELDENDTGFGPGENGNWIGPGLTEVWDDTWFFSPAEAGIGLHWIYYEKNNCTDSVLVTIYPANLVNDAFILCENEAAFELEPGLMAGGTWNGPGITDPAIGIFDPSLAGPGDFYVHWNTPAGCQDSIHITVEAFEQASITGLNTLYCYTDLDILFAADPPGGILSGSSTGLNFNPSLYYPSAEFIYTWNGIQCASADTITIEIYPPLAASLSVSATPICQGESSLLGVEAMGGNPDLQYTYDWSNNGFPISNNTFSPDVTTTYTVEVSDGCSDSATDSATVVVLPPVDVNVVVSDTLCFGETGFADASAAGLGDYSFNWDGADGSELVADAGSAHELTVTDLVYGCVFDTLVLLPSYPPVSAFFLITPNEDCMSFEDAATIVVIDLSQNAVSGEWHFGSATEPYVPGDNPGFSQGQAGSLTVSLDVVNVGGCPASYSEDLCVLPPTPIFIPDIFSPNQDGYNDVLFVRSQGILTMSFRIYDRWGELVFESNSPESGWDGNHRGRPAPGDTYSYVLIANLNDGTTEEMSGQIALIR